MFGLQSWTLSKSRVAATFWPGTPKPQTLDSPDSKPTPGTLNSNPPTTDSLRTEGMKANKCVAKHCASTNNRHKHLGPQFFKVAIGVWGFFLFGFSSDSMYPAIERAKQGGN